MLAKLLVQRGKRFIQKQKLWLPGKRPRKGHALLLAAGDLVRLAMAELGQLHKVKHLGDPRGLVRLAHAAFMLEPVADVRLDRHVRKDRIGLEHHVDRALPRRNSCHVAPVKEDAARCRLLEPGHHAQKGGLATARPAQKGEDFPLCDGQANIPDRLKRTE